MVNGKDGTWMCLKKIVKHKDKKFFGVLFHPEVRNESVIENFLKI